MVCRMAVGELERPTLPAALVTAKEHQDDGKNKGSASKTANHTTNNLWSVKWRRVPCAGIASSGGVCGCGRAPSCGTRAASYPPGAAFAVERRRSGSIERLCGCCER